MGLKMQPLVSVIITTKNEAEVVERLLRSVNSQTYKNYEVIVVDNKSTDITLQIANKYTTKVYQQGPERSAQRNFGIKKCKGEYVLILDADMQLHNDLLQVCVESINKEKLVGGLVIPERSATSSFWGRVKAHERSFYLKDGYEVAEAARFFKKDLVLKVGGYDESLTGPEDWDLPESIKKIGYKISRISGTYIIHHERVAGPVKLAQKKFYYALKSHRYLRKQGISPVSPKTIYFLRTVFYKNYKMFLSRPLLSAAMIIMFTFELVGGGLGYLYGKITNK